MDKTIVVAKYNEVTDWVEQVDGWNYFVVTKDIHIPNFGRESLSYLWYILENWDTLQGHYVFLQGNPSPHWYAFTGLLPSLELQDFKWLGDNGYECYHDGTPHHSGLPIKDIADKIGLVLPDTIKFIAGGQFLISTEKIKSKPKEFYQKLYDLHMEYEKMPWVIERLWGYIYQ
jgi:hypothetical protein